MNGNIEIYHFDVNLLEMIKFNKQKGLIKLIIQGIGNYKYIFEYSISFHK